MLGIGNATGLGMAPFLIGHPILIDHWMFAREAAIARVRAIESAEAECAARFREVLDRAIRYLGEWRTGDRRQMARIETLRREMPAFRDWAAEANPFGGAAPWDAIAGHAAAHLSAEAQEMINSLILEPHGDLIDDLEDTLAADERLSLDPAMTLAALAQLIRANYAWALEPDYEDPAERHFFWYVSEEKLEPRLGERFEEPGADKEMPIGVARDVKRLYAAIKDCDPATTAAAFLMRNPEHRRILRRVQGLCAHPYAEIRDNLLARDGFAFPAIDAAFAHLIPAAREQSIASVGIRGSYNCGVLGQHVEALARAGLVGLGFTNAPASIAPVGGRKPVVGTNPMACAVPDGKGGAAFVIDQSSSVVAKSEVIQHAKRGEPIPEGWALDPDGKATTDAALGLKGSMAPSGGYKGFGAGLIVEVFAAALTGATLGLHASSFGANEGGPPRTGQFFLAADPAAFSGGAFAERIAALTGAIADQEGARLPGAKRRAARAQVERDGIAVADDLLARIRGHAA